MKSAIIVLNLDSKPSQVFGKQSVLENKTIHHLLYLSDAVKAPDTSDNLTNVAAYVTLIDKENQAVHESIPLLMLNYKNSERFPVNLSGVNWDKSKVDFPDAAGISGKSLVFQVLYT